MIGTVVFRSMLLVIVVGSNLAVQAQTGASFSLQINGQVRYAASKTPVANAIVRIERSNGGMVGQQLTDQTGKFSFTGLGGQMYTVTIHAPGYKEFRQDIDLLTANTGYVSAFLEKDASAVENSSRGLRPLAPGVIDSGVPVEAQKEYAEAKTLIESGDGSKLSRAIAHLDKSITLYPKYTEALLARGLAYMDLRDWSKAERSMKAAIDAAPEAVTAYWALGEVYTRQKKWADAVDVLTKGIAINDKVAEGHYGLGEAHWEMAPTAKDEAAFKRSLEDSWKEVRRALELDPQHARAHLLAGNLLLKARQPQEALKHFETYLKLEPKGELAEPTKALVLKIKQAIAQNPKIS